MDVCKAENIYYSTGAYSSVVAAWNADQKDTSTYFITILIALLYFKSEGCWFESREEQIFKIRSTQIWNIPTPLLCQGSAQWPHLGKKCWTQKRRLGFVPLSLISLWTGVSSSSPTFIKVRNPEDTIMSKMSIGSFKYSCAYSCKCLVLMYDPVFTNIYVPVQ